jgi:pyruvate dehydrogenase E1 component
VIFAYTIKGYGLEMAGRPQNHSALLTGVQVDDFRAEVGLTPLTEWDGSPARGCGGNGAGWASQLKPESERCDSNHRQTA